MIINIEIALGLLAAFVTAGVLIPLLDNPAHRFGLVDRPDPRKRHRVATPLTGGLAVFGGFFIGFLVMDASLLGYWTLVTGVLVLLLTGLADDFVEVPAVARLLIQVGVACLVVFGGGLKIQVVGPLLGESLGIIGLGPFAEIFTIACIVFMINAFNMMDGLDGLAGGSAFIILAMMAVIARVDGADPLLFVTCSLLAASVLGFLVHNLRLPNRPHARAFLGDTGSMAIGFAIAWMAVRLATLPDSTVEPITMAWLLIVPAMDTLALFFRRLRTGRSPFAPDRAHMHHILQRAGMPISAAVATIHALVLAAGLFGIAGWLLDWSEAFMFFLAAAVLLGYMAFLARAHRVIAWARRRRRVARDGKS